MPTFQHSELLPEHEILQYKIPAATEGANKCLYQINHRKYCCNLLSLRSARVLARDRYEITYRARRFKYRRALATLFFTSKRAAERYAREHFAASEQARVRILSGK
jgi:hypothetical protein